MSDDVEELKARIAAPCMTCLAAHRMCAQCREDLAALAALTDHPGGTDK